LPFRVVGTKCKWRARLHGGPDDGLAPAVLPPLGNRDRLGERRSGIGDLSPVAPRFGRDEVGAGHEGIRSPTAGSAATPFGPSPPLRCSISPKALTLFLEPLRLFMSILGLSGSGRRHSHCPLSAVPPSRKATTPRAFLARLTVAQKCPCRSTEEDPSPGRGRHADAPWQIPLRGRKDILRRTYEQIGRTGY
jgi:hypothetical protein